MYSRALSILLVLLVVGGIGIAPTAAVDGSSAGVDSVSTIPETDTPMISVDKTGGEQRVIVRLVDPPASATQAATTDDRKSQMRAHAAASQSTFERFAAGNPHVEIERSLWITNALVVTADTDRIPIERLGFVDNVEAVHEDFEVEINTVAASSPATSTPIHPSLATASGVDATWGVERIRAPETWADFENRGEGVRIAVLDTGVDGDHPDINIDVAGWKDFSDDPSSTPKDYGDHGTHVSGTVVGGNASGTAIGVAPEAELYHGAVLTNCDSGQCSGTFSQVVDGMQWAVDNNADVVSMSLGVNGYDHRFIDPIRNARAAGTLLVTSSGNSGADSSSSPGNIYDAFSVGATNDTDGVASFSSGETIQTDDAWGDDAPDDWPTQYVVPNISAPGSSVESAVPGGGYATKSGTSMAAPHISGAIALLLSNGNGDLSPTEIEQLLTSEAVNISEPAARQGAGRLDVYNATLAHSRATLEPTISPQQANVSVPTTLSVGTNHPIEAYHWQFENGTTVTTTEPTIERTFENLSTVETVSVTLQDERGNSTTVDHEIEVVDKLPPVATLSATHSAGVEVGLDDVEFNASNSTDNDEIDRYEWAFGDGTNKTTQTPTAVHRYEDRGEFEASVTVVDASENTNTTTVDIGVVDTTPPVANITAPAVAYAEYPVTLSGTNSTDNDEIASFEWTLGDDTVTTSDPEINYTFFETGVQNVTLTATDQAGNTNTTTAEIMVREPPTVAVFSPAEGDIIGSESVTVEYTISNTSFDGVDGIEYRITNKSTDEVVTDWTAGPYEDTDDPVSVSMSTGSLVDGEYSVELRLVDAAGEPLSIEPASDSVSFSVKTTPPTVDLDVTPGSTEFEVFGPNNPAELNVTVDDPLDTTTHLQIADSTGSIVSEWNLSDATGNGESVRRSWNATNDSTPVDSGLYTVTLRAADGIGNSDKITTEIDVDTDSPIVSLAALTNTTTIDDGLQYINSTDQPEFNVTATDGRESAGEVATVDITVTASSTNHRRGVTATHTGTNEWTAAFDASRLRVEGQYNAILTTTDRAGNTNTTTVEELLSFSTSEPDVVGVIVDTDGSHSDIEVRTDRPLKNTPNATVFDPDETATTVDLTANGTHWEGTFDSSKRGLYELTVDGTDRHGNRGTDSSSISVESASTTENEVTIYNNKTGTFIHLETDHEVEEQFVVISESSRSPATLEAGQFGIGFLTSSLADELANNITSATVAIPTETYQPPTGLSAADERVSISYYNESTKQWEDRETTVETISADEFGPEIEGEYWTTTVESFSSYGVTATDSDPPRITDRSPAVDETLDAETDAVTITIEYEDDLSSVDTDAIEFRVDGEDLTTDTNTDITASSLSHSNFAVSEDATYTVEIYLTDTSGNDNGRWYEYEFSVEAVDDGDDNGGDSGDGTGDDDGGEDNGDTEDRDDDGEDDVDEGDDADDNDDETDDEGDDADDDGGDDEGRDDGEGDVNGVDEASTSEDDAEDTDHDDELETVDDETPGFGVVTGIFGLLGILVIRRLRARAHN